MKLRLAPAPLLLALAACQPASPDQSGATIRVDVIGTATDPAGAPRRVIAAATQAGLTDFDASGRVVPGLASSWRVSNDGRSVIFRLRPAAWADGRKLVGGDVVSVFRRIIAPASINPLKPEMAMIENAAAIAAGHAAPASLGVNAPLDTVVEIRLAAASPGLLTLLAQPDLAITRGGPRPPALGAFALKDAATRPVVLTRNAAYYDAANIGLGRIELTPVEDPGMAVARFAHDRTDIVTGSGLAGLSDARLLGPQVLRVEPATGIYGYLANVRSGPLADVRVRRALAMAITRDGLGARLFGIPAMLPVIGMLPPGMASAPVATLPDWAMLAPAARLDTARALLAAAGFDAAHPLAFAVSLPPGREHASVFAAVAADWSAIGVTASAREMSPTDLALALKRGDFELALSERIAPVETAAFFLGPFRCGVGSGGYCNPAADLLLDAAATDPGAVATAEAAFMADAPLIALFRPVRWSLVQPRVTGWTDNSAGAHPLARLGMTPKRGAR